MNERTNVAFAPLTSRDSYRVVFDIIVEDLPDGLYLDLPRGKGNNPKAAVHEYLRSMDGQPGWDGSSLMLKIDKALESKLLTIVAPHGYLRRT